MSLFYHICLVTEYPEGKFGKTQDDYWFDFTEEHLHNFVALYRQGRPLKVDNRIISPRLFKSLSIGATDHPSTVILPPIKAEIEREASIKKARELEENRRNRIAVFNPYDFSGVFFPGRTLMALASDRTSEFILKFKTTPECHQPSGDSDDEAQGLDSKNLVALQQRRRFRYLEHLYLASGADSSRMFHWREVGTALGMSDDIASIACGYLRQKKLANGEYMTDGISQAGIDEYEQAITRPNQPTTHFAGDVTINAGHGSSVMLASSGAQQTITNGLKASDMAGVAELIGEIRRVLPDLGLEQDVREDFDVVITDLEALAQRPSPSRPKLRSALRSAGSLLESFSVSVTANALTQPILLELHRLLQMLAS